MSTTFNTILIPVDFTLNTEVAIAKTLGLVDAAGTHIHLLHVQKQPLLSRMVQDIGWLVSDIRRERLEHKLDHLALRIKQVRPGITVSCYIEQTSSVEEAVARMAILVHADLVVIGKRSSGFIFHFQRKIISARIASATGIPVLTVKPGSLKTPIRTVVIPVGPKFPSKKLELLDAWKNNPGFVIRLVSCLDHDKDDGGTKDSLLNTFSMLKTNWPGRVEYDVLRGNNPARSLLKYCHKVNADLLIVYPGIETNTGLFPNLHISDMLPADSQTQVLAIQPV